MMLNRVDQPDRASRADVPSVAGRGFWNGPPLVSVRCENCERLNGS